MKVDKTENICGFADEALAYVYNELPAAARDRFDLHLVQCSHCIDELAELSYSFYSVHEWRQLEFDPLPTPVFWVPIAEAAPSLAARIKAVLFPTPARLAFAGAFGALVVTGVIAFNLIARSDQEFAAVVVQEAPLPSGFEMQPATSGPTDAVKNERGNSPFTVVAAPVVTEQPERIERGRIAKPVNRSTGSKDRLLAPRPTVAEAATSPRLSDFEDSPDDSLRLSDMLAEADARD